MRTITVLLVLLATSAAAQVTTSPNEPPVVTAVNDDWYRLGQPIPFGGQMYHPAGPDVFFDGNVMVRTGHHNGVPLYADATLEPYSVVFVPIDRGLMRPYQRRAAPIRDTRVPERPRTPPARAAASAPPDAVGTAGRSEVPTAVGTTGRLSTPSVTPPSSHTAVAVQRPRGNDGLWISYAGEKWVSAGPAIEVATASLSHVGDYAGFPVYMRADREDVIYLPGRSGWIAPYRRR